MATAGVGPAAECVEKYDFLTQLIENTFTEYHSILDTQKDKLLEIVSTMKQLFITHSDIEEAIKQIENVKSATNDVVMKNLVAGNEEHIEGDKITELSQTKAKLESVSDLEFVPKTNEFSQCVNSIRLLGCLVEEYNERIQPVVFQVATDDEGRVGMPRGIAVDRQTDLVYVTQLILGCVDVYSQQGKFIGKFGEFILVAPNGICLSDKFVFVTDSSRNNIIKFSKAGHYLADTSIVCDRMCVYNNQAVYVCNHQKKRIEAFSIDLSRTGSFGKGKIGTPIDIRVHNCVIYVLDNKQIHSFSQKHNHLKSILLIGCGCELYEDYFVVDKDGNFIVSSRDKSIGNCWNVYSHSGELKESLGRGYLGMVSGIDINRHNQIITLSQPLPMASLQIY